MPTQTKPPRLDHPSNRLYHGQVRDFTEAVSVFKAAIAFERSWQRTFVREYPDMVQPGDTAPDDLLKDTELRADRALAIYAETMANAQRAAVAALRLADLTDWADALEEGSYERLAI